MNGWIKSVKLLHPELSDINQHLFFLGLPQKSDTELALTFFGLIVCFWLLVGLVNNSNVILQSFLLFQFLEIAVFSFKLGYSFAEFTSEDVDPDWKRQSSIVFFFLFRTLLIGENLHFWIKTLSDYCLK